MATARVRSDLFTPVTTRRTVENVIEQIVDKLRAGLVSEGEFLPSERTLAEVMVVSRRTIREAIRILAGAGVVSVLPGASGGIRVRSIWVPGELGSEAPAVLQADKIFEVLEARRTVEPRVAQLAGVRARDEDFASMRNAIDLQWKHRDDRRKVSQLNFLFHRQMWRAAANETLEGAMKLIYRQLDIALDMTIRTPPDTKLSIEIHERTLEALMRGGSEEIAEAMDEHMGYLEMICESVVGRRRLRSIPEFLQSADPSGK
jgi:GntR family transcriptional regulator, transcriptional repressor for pyruvate dehydrogenase complex